MRQPAKADGIKVARLIASCPPLDRNSVYCNVLQCTHFARTSMLAECDGEVVGWVSGYRLPDDPETLFIWQVAVSSSVRGKGVGGTLIKALLASEGAQGVKRIQTTITGENDRSWALFKSIASASGAALTHDEWLRQGQELSEQSPSERLVTIGPLKSA